MTEISRKIKEYLLKLDPKTLGLAHKAESISVQKLGLGESNLNYLAIIDGNKFVVRVNMDPSSPDKSRMEYESLKAVSHLGIAPRVFHYETSKDYVGETFMILEYLEGNPLDQRRRTDYATVEMLGNVISRLHNSEVKGLKDQLKKHDSSKTGLLNEIQRRIDYIKAKRDVYFGEDGEFAKLFEEPYNILEQSRFHKESCYVLGHGDVCPQNIIVSQGKLKIIDWEDLGLIDPALEISIIFDAFDFSKKQKEIFLEAYMAARKDSTLRDRIANFLPFQTFGVFCWAIMHVYEIEEREMHEAFLEEQDLKEHIKYAQKMFNKCKKMKIVDKNASWNVSDIFPENYLAS